jgi:hypothetical protein
MKYNKTKIAAVQKTVTTHQGGTGYELKPELALLSLLANDIKDTYYEKESEQEARLVDLINQVAAKDPLLVAKMLVYTRSVTGQRSVTHRAAVALAPYVSGKPWATDFYSKRDRDANFGGVVYRVDDMLEIASCYAALNPGKRLPNAMTRGFKSALGASDAYELAKYKGEGKDLTLIDLVNLVKPVPTGRNGAVQVDKEKYKLAVKNSKKGYQDKPVKDLENGKVQISALTALILGLLDQHNTIEDKTSKLGQKVAAEVASGVITQAEGDAKLKSGKEEIFTTSISGGGVGYLALIQNLRNLLKNATSKESIDAAIKQLTDEVGIKKSLIAPHKIDIALEVILAEFGAGYISTPLLEAINKAYELSIPNLKELGAYGRTAVVYDSSGSMTDGRPMYLNEKLTIRDKKEIDKAVLIAATLAKGINADVYTFGGSCGAVKFNPLDTINTIKSAFRSMAGTHGGSTVFSSIFGALNGKYDRIFIISDMQGQDDITRSSSFQAYKSKHGEPHVYTINLCGYGTTMIKPGSKVYQIFGYNADIYELAGKMEVNPQILLDQIKAINISQKVKKNSKLALRSEKV